MTTSPAVAATFKAPKPSIDLMQHRGDLRMVRLDATVNDFFGQR
jgi:hypothetical protein